MRKRRAEESRVGESRGEIGRHCRACSRFPRCIEPRRRCARNKEPAPIIRARTEREHWGMSTYLRLSFHLRPILSPRRSERRSPIIKVVIPSSHFVSRWKLPLIVRTFARFERIDNSFWAVTWHIYGTRYLSSSFQFTRLLPSTRASRPSRNFRHTLDLNRVNIPINNHISSSWEHMNYLTMYVLDYVYKIDFVETFEHLTNCIIFSLIYRNILLYL